MFYSPECNFTWLLGYFRSIFDITYYNNPVNKQNEETTFINFIDFVDDYEGMHIQIFQ